MAHGYAKIEGKPMMVMAHGTVGLQHASMAIYNAYADRVPVYHRVRQHPRCCLSAKRRRMDARRAGCGGDGARLHQVGRHAVSLTHFAESSVRAYKIAMTPPYGPVVIVADAMLQEGAGLARRSAAPARPAAHAATPPAADAGAVAELAKLLVAAENPLIVTGRVARTPNGLTLLVEFAELLQAPVIDGRFVYRMNFPTRHPLRSAARRGRGRSGARSGASRAVPDSQRA